LRIGAASLRLRESPVDAGFGFKFACLVDRFLGI
jgi:hypothetical protein